MKNEYSQKLKFRNNMSKKTEEIEVLAIEYADSKEKRMTSAWQGLKFGFIAGYTSKDKTIVELESQICTTTDADFKIIELQTQIKELEKRLKTAKKVIKRTNDWLHEKGNDFSEDIMDITDAWLRKKQSDIENP
jgi:hypothetical protein